MKLSQDEKRLIALFRLLPAQHQAEILTEAALKGMKNFAVYPWIERISNFKEILAEEISEEGQDPEILQLRLLGCLPDVDSYPWLSDMEVYMSEVVASCFPDELPQVILGNSYFDETNALALQDAIEFFGKEHRISVGPLGPNRFIVPVDELIAFIQDWRERVIAGLQRQIRKAHLDKGSDS